MSSECGPDYAEYHLAKLYERLLQETARSMSRRSQVHPVQIAPDVQ